MWEAQQEPMNKRVEFLWRVDAMYPFSTAAQERWLAQAARVGEAWAAERSVRRGAS
jgi:hypothetical protein